MMSFVHFLTYRFVISSFQGITYIEYTLNFFDYVFGTHVIFFTDISFCLCQHIHCTVTQEFYMRMFFLDGSHSSLAALTTFVVCR